MKFINIATSCFCGGRRSSVSSRRRKRRSSETEAASVSSVYGAHPAPPPPLSANGTGVDVTTSSDGISSPRESASRDVDGGPAKMVEVEPPAVVPIAIAEVPPPPPDPRDPPAVSPPFSPPFSPPYSPPCMAEFPTLHRPVCASPPSVIPLPSPAAEGGATATAGAAGGRGGGKEGGSGGGGGEGARKGEKATPAAAAAAVVSPAPASFPYHRAVFEDSLDSLWALCLREVKGINAKDHNGYTALKLAVKLGKIEAAEALLDAGAEVLEDKPDPTRAAGHFRLSDDVALLGSVPLLMRVALLEQRAGWGRWRRRVPVLLDRLEALPDFYVEMRWEFGSSTVLSSLVKALTPHDTYRIWKRGSWLRMDTTITGILGRFKVKRGNMSLIFMGKDSRCPGYLVRIDRDKKKVYNALRKLYRMSDDEASTFCRRKIDRPRREKTKCHYDGLTFHPLTTGVGAQQKQKTCTIEKWRCQGFECSGHLLQQIYTQQHATDWAESVTPDTYFEQEGGEEEPKQEGDGAGKEGQEGESRKVRTGMLDAFRTTLTSSFPSSGSKYKGKVEMGKHTQGQTLLREKETRMNATLWLTESSGSHPPHHQQQQQQQQQQSQQPQEMGRGWPKSGGHSRGISSSSVEQGQRNDADYPLSLQDVLPIFEVMSLGDELVDNVREILQSDGLPVNGFPMRMTLPLMMMVRADMAFQNINARDPIDPMLFMMPPEYTYSRRVRRSRLAGAKPGEVPWRDFGDSESEEWEGEEEKEEVGEMGGEGGVGEVWKDEDSPSLAGEGKDGHPVAGEGLADHRPDGWEESQAEAEEERAERAEKAEASGADSALSLQHAEEMADSVLMQSLIAGYGHPATDLSDIEKDDSDVGGEGYVAGDGVDSNDGESVDSFLQGVGVEGHDMDNEGRRVRISSVPMGHSRTSSYSHSRNGSRNGSGQIRPSLLAAPSGAHYFDTSTSGDGVDNGGMLIDYDDATGYGGYTTGGVDGDVDDDDGYDTDGGDISVYSQTSSTGSTVLPEGRDVG